MTLYKKKIAQFPVMRYHESVSAKWPVSWINCHHSKRMIAVSSQAAIVGGSLPLRSVSDGARRIMVTLRIVSPIVLPNKTEPWCSLWACYQQCSILHNIINTLSIPALISNRPHPRGPIARSCWVSRSQLASLQSKGQRLSSQLAPPAYWRAGCSFY
jgi:hypothetical protein